MIGGGLGVRTRQWAVACIGFLASVPAQAASVADCPGHPDALGTSRTLVVDPREHTRIGTMQYAETLPLADHEVVLTFDDGPLPHNSNQILEILASQCVKATFFIIGRMAQAYPEGVRKVRDAGHSIGTHSQNHPLSFDKMPAERAKQEIDEGIASVKSALGADTALAPFFRIPGLRRAEAVEDYLASQGIQAWSADFPADDWRHVPSSRVYDLAIQRIEAKGKGILLLHDIQARTVAALPRILHELKARGYRIVHVVPATTEVPATPTEPQQWHLHPSAENIATTFWPIIPGRAPTAADLRLALAPEAEWRHGQVLTLADLSERAGQTAKGVALPREVRWPAQSPRPPANAATTLPVPSRIVFEMQWSGAITLGGASSSRYAQQAASTGQGGDARGLRSADAGESRRTVGLRSHPGRGRQVSATHLTRHGAWHATHSGRRGLKRLVQVKKRSA